MYVLQERVVGGFDLERSVPRLSADSSIDGPVQVGLEASKRWILNGVQGWWS